MINDPMSQMAQAQKLSIPQLQQALRDGTINPQVGQIVLASKIKQDKDAKAAMAAQAPKQPPVVQQNAAYGQGVDALPSNLPVAGMAGGGIIAFDEGGEVIRAAKGLPPEAFQGYNYDSEQDWNKNYREANQTNIDERLSEQYPDMPKQIQQYAGVTPFDAALNYYKQPVMQSNAWGTSGLPDDARRTAISKLEQQRSAWLAGHKNPMTKELPLGAKANPAVVDVKKATPAVQPTPAAATPATPAASGPKLTLDDYFKSMDSGSVSTRTKTKGTGSKGIADGYEIKKYDDKELQDIYKSELNPDTGKPYTYDEIAKRDRKQAEAAGIDFDVYKSQREDLDKLKAKSAERSKLDSAMPWFAAAEAFGRQPRTGEAPQSTIGAITSALGAYGKSATDIDEKELARQEKIRSEGNALALAQNAFNQAQYSGNKADLKEAQSAVRSARTNLANLGMKGIDQQNEVAKTVYEVNAKKDIAEMQERGANARVGQEGRTIKDLARIIHDAHPEMPLDEVMKKAYQTKAAGSIYSADLRDVSGQRANITKLLQEAIKTPAYSTADKQAKDARIAELTRQLNAIGSDTGAVDTSGTAGGNTVDFSKLPK